MPARATSTITTTAQTACALPATTLAPPAHRDQPVLHVIQPATVISRVQRAFVQLATMMPTSKPARSATMIATPAQLLAVAVHAIQLASAQ